MPAFIGFVLTLEPGCVYPSMNTGLVMSGRKDVRVIVSSPRLVAEVCRDVDYASRQSTTEQEPRSRCDVDCP
jgi:hypothetical protein